MYRRGLCLDGRGSDAGHHGTEMAATVRPRTNGRSAAQDYAAAQVSDDVCSRAAVNRKGVGKVLTQGLSLPTNLGAPYLARFSRDVGYHEPQPFASRDESRLKSRKDRPVVSHISRKTSEMWGTR